MEANSFLQEVTTFYMGGSNDSNRAAFPVCVPIQPKFPCVSIISFIFLFI